MDELTDFEELIDVSKFLASTVNTIEDSQKNSQESISDVLDKMCKAMSESNLAIDNLLEGGEEETDGNVADDSVIDLDEFETYLATACFSNDCFEDVDTGDNMADSYITNREQNKTINAVFPYEVPIDFEDIGPNINECVLNDSEKDEKLSSFIDLTIEHETSAFATSNVKEIENFNDLKTIEIKEDTKDALKPADNEYKHEGPETANLIEWKDKLVDSPTFTEDVSDDGYNSSDFEIISETEATQMGIVTRNYNANKPTLQYEHDCNNNNFGSTNSTAYSTLNPKDCTNRPTTSCNNRPTTSRRNEARYSDYIKYSKYRYQRCYAHHSSEHHVIPDGEQYLDLFRGEYSPMIISNLHVLKNKNVPPTKAMTVQSDDVWFNIPNNMNEDNEEYKGDAAECAKIILSTYPGENRRKRRRF